MRFDRLCILLGAVWCLYGLVISVLGAVVAIACTSPDIPACGEAGFQAGSWWARAAWFAVPLFAAGAFHGFRAVAPDLKALVQRIRARTRRGSGTSA